jgi:hypothetical protein
MGRLRLDLTTAAKHTHVEAIIKGDRQVLSIAAAAIMAKYDRDQDMLALPKNILIINGRTTKAMARLTISLPLMPMGLPLTTEPLIVRWLGD